VNVSGPVLVTGAAGFAGGHLVEHLAGRGEMAAWSRTEPPAEIAALARWSRVDLLDRDLVRREIRALRPAAVFHCAGVPHVGASWQNTSHPLAGNVLTTHYLLDALRRAGRPCRVLVAGSALVYRASTSPLHESDPLGPASPYGLSKLAQELLGRRSSQEDGLDVILTRPFNHTGPRQRPSFMAPSVARQIALIEAGRLDSLLVGNLEATRDLTDVRDIVRAYAMLMETGTPGAVYNVGSGKERPVRAVVDALVARARVPVPIAHDPERLRPNDTPVLVGDNTRLRQATGWEPAISFDRMIDDLLDYWRTVVRQ